MIWSFIATCCFALVAAIIFSAACEVYHCFSPHYIDRREILKSLDRMAAAEERTLKNDAVFPPVHREAMVRVNTIICIKEIIKHL